MLRSCKSLSEIFFEQVITDRTTRTAWEEVTQALSLEDMGALERAVAWEGGRTADAAGVGLTGG